MRPSPIHNVALVAATLISISLLNLLAITIKELEAKKKEILKNTLSALGKPLLTTEGQKRLLLAHGTQVQHPKRPGFPRAPKSKKEQRASFSKTHFDDLHKVKGNIYFIY